MKAKANLIYKLTLGVSLGLAVLAQAAHAGDVNPQTDPTGQSAKAAKSAGQHNPPSDKGSLIDPNNKGGLVDPNEKRGVIDPNERAAKGAVIDPNDKRAKGLLIDPNDKKH